MFPPLSSHKHQTSADAINSVGQGAVVNLLTQNNHFEVETSISAGGTHDIQITYDESTADAAAEDTSAAGKPRSVFKFLPPLYR
jgi:hypothetical protein